MPLESGSFIGSIVGNYRIDRMLGSGGMGEVYSAVDPHGRWVAIKILHRHAARDPDLVARFEREAAIASRIHSPYVAGIVGNGREPNDCLWIAFELLNGEGLDARLAREHYLSFAEIAPIVDDILQGLISAHQAGVVHRDIKPANLFVEQRALSEVQLKAGESIERTRILDFGVSKVRVASALQTEQSLTAYDATIGSFAYMAPEQVRGSARVDVRADLYALGAVTFRALAGRLPFEAQNAIAVLALKLDREAPTLRMATEEEWPASIERFSAQMIARDREKRFPSAEAALAAWRRTRAEMGGLPSPRLSKVSADELLGEASTEMTEISETNPKVPNRS